MRPAVPLLALVLAAPAARGQDVAPVISRVEMSGQRVRSVVGGAAITIVGARLHECPASPVACEHPDVRVSIDGKACRVLSAAADRLRVLVPADASVGKVVLRVALVGRGAAETAVVVLDQSEWIHAPPRPGEDEGERRRAAKERAISASFSIDRFELARDQRGWRFEVEGKATRLDDGLELYVTLTQGAGDLVAAARVAVRRGKWTVSFGPASAPYPPGGYCASMEFTLGTQQRVRVKRLRDRLEADEHELLDRIFRREFLHLGAPVEVEAQRTALRDHVRGALDAADRLLDDVERAYASASRAAFARALPLWLGCPGRAGLLVVPGVDAAAHRAHLEAIGLAPTEARLAYLVTDDRFGAALGQVDGPALRAWLEGEALPAHATLDTRVRAFDERTAVPIDCRASGALALLVDDLARTLRRSARAMFRTAGVIPPPSLGEHDAEHDRALDRAGLDARRAELFQRVGLR